VELANHTSPAEPHAPRVNSSLTFKGEFDESTHE
jgi:hypothetical protein